MARLITVKDDMRDNIKVDLDELLYWCSGSHHLTEEEKQKAEKYQENMYITKPLSGGTYFKGMFINGKYVPMKTMPKKGKTIVQEIFEYYEEVMKQCGKI